MVLKGSVAWKNIAKPKIVISAIEHSSIYDTCIYLKSCGVNISIVPVDSTGQINLEFLKMR